MLPALRRGSAVRAVRRGAGVGDGGEVEAKGVNQRPCFTDVRKSEFCELRSFLQSIGSAADQKSPQSSQVLEGFLNGYRSLPKSRGVSFLTGSCIL